MKKQLMLSMLLLASTVFAQASEQYDEAAKYAGSVKDKGMTVMKGTDPAATIPGYTANPDESGYYGGTTATSNTDLENAGNSEMHNGEAGKTIMDVIKNRPKDPISPDAPFISGSLDVEDKADTIMSGTDTQCKDVDVDKTQITNYTCERTPAVELTCTRTADISGHWENSTAKKTYTITGKDLGLPDYDHRYDSGNGTRAINVNWTSPVSGKVLSASMSWSWDGLEGSFALDAFLLTMHTPFGSAYMESKTGSVAMTAGQQLSQGQSLAFSATNKKGSLSTYYIWAADHHQMTLTLQIEEPSQTWVPEVVWSESCPFDKNDQVLMNSACTQPGGDRVVTVGGHPYTVHSDCWQYTDTYVSQSADNGTCNDYMQNPACTVASTTCLDSLNGTCLREQAVFSCEEKVSGSAQLCGGELVCTDGSCDQLDNGKSNSFQSAVSGLAALAAAGKDIAALNGVNVSAFTGEGHSCLKAMAGFSNCCKDSGWGNDVGLASCNTEEKALAEAKKRKLSIYVGSWCAHKVLGVCMEKKEGYCQFDSKLAKIVQDQGRRGQLGIGFGSGDSPDCRGLTVDELKRLKFDQMNFADFYDDLENGTTLPTDQALLDRIKEQIAGQMTGGVQ